MTLQKPQTALELGLMQGYPPNQPVTHAVQLLGPYNRWSFQNLLPLNHTIDVWRGAGPVMPLNYAPQPLDTVTYQNRAGAVFTFDDMVELSYADGIIVLHRGKVIYERYLNGMKPETLHAWASASKSMTGTLAAMFAHQGLFDVHKLVSYYLPELRDSGFGDATVQQVMDMTTAVRFTEDDGDGVVENLRYGVAMGWRTAPDGYGGPRSVYEFLPTMRKAGEHGACFQYLTPNTDVLAWLLRRLLNRSLAGIMHDHLWSRLGVMRDAFWIVGGAAAETAGSGLVTTLPDMARFGQMLLQKGAFDGVQVIPESVVEDIQRGGSKEAFARGPAAGPGNQGYSYHNQWWNTHSRYGAYQAIGYGGQVLYIAPGAELVVAKMSSYPTPTPAGNEFYATFAALPALVEWLVRQG